jgi:hypothetical protein
MHYTDKALKDIVSAISELRFNHINLIQKLGPFAETLHNERAKEYILHGVLRRLFILYRCIENIFRIFPADRVEKLTDDERGDLEINMHCFLINTYGIIENLGLSIAFENGMIDVGVSEQSKRNEIGLFNRKFKSKVNPVLKAYLNNSKIHDWYNEYAKNYRDALVHRIPPYVPPSVLDKDDKKEFITLNEKLAALSKNGYSKEYSETIDKMVKVGKNSPFYVHSFFEKAKPIYLHPQIIADLRTVEELINVVIANYKV